MRALLRVALAEFAKAFAPKVGTPAARDFLWLTIFFVLSAFLVFVGLSARNGVWARFEQVLLGALPGGGPPIRIATGIDLVEKISPGVLKQFAQDFPDLTFVPMRRFDGETGAITLPGRSFQARTDEERRLSPEGKVALQAERQVWNERELPFQGYAVPLDSPLWAWIKTKGDGVAADEPAPLVVAASRTLFRKYFRAARYSEALQDVHVPCTMRRAPDGDADLPRELVLQVKEGARRGETGRGATASQMSQGPERVAYQAFKVLWVDSFPLPEQVAMIMPLSTLEVAMAAEQRRGMLVYLEGRGEPTERVSAVRLHDIDVDDSGVTAFQDMAKCLGAAPDDAPTGTPVCGLPLELSKSDGPVVAPRLQADTFELLVSASPEWPLRARDIDTCWRGAGSVARAKPRNFLLETTAPSAPAKWVSFSRVAVPCRVLVDADQQAATTLAVPGEQRCEADSKPDSVGVATLTGYDDATVYAGARGSQAESGSQSLKEVVEDLLDWEYRGRKVFRLDPAYESALIRFGVLSTVLDRMALPVAGGLGVLYVVLCGIILATTFLHRRTQYGLLFMNGVQPWRLEVLVFMQIGLACLIGCAVGYLVFLVVAHVLNDLLKATAVIQEAGLTIGLEVPVFLDRLRPLQVIAIWGSMTFISFAIGSALLRLQGISVAKAPIDLIKS